MLQEHSALCELGTISALLPAFDFQGLIAQGATGAVYKARQRSLDRDVAIRIAPREKGNEPAFRNSFQAMAKAMASLAHPNLIRAYDSGEVDGRPYLVMEYVPGKSLQHSARGKAIDPRQAVQIVIAACQGIAHAHCQGIAHGAIRPANILLTPKCEPKIGNFDLSNASARTAPDLAGGGRSDSPQADVYAIGMMLQELLTGSPTETTDPSRLAFPDSKLAAICRKATHPDPAQRFPDAVTLAESLVQWQASRPLLRTLPSQQTTASYRPKAPLTSKVPTIVRPTPRAGRGLLVHGTIIAALLLAIHGVWGAYQAKQESLARLRSMEDGKPRMIIIKAQQGYETPQAIDSSLVQLKR